MKKTESYKRSTYSYWFLDEILSIEDLDQGGMSVTNNIEGILAKIEHDEKRNLIDYKIIYKDTENNWDEIIPSKFHDEYHVDFNFLGAKTELEAIRKIKLKYT